MISSIRSDGSTACMTTEGPTTAEVFRTYVRSFLLPTLRGGDIVILDNLSFHKDSHAIELIQQAGAHVWFLPSYSPDLHPRSAWQRHHQHRFCNIGSLPAMIHHRFHPTQRFAVGWQ